MNIEFGKIGAMYSAYLNRFDIRSLFALLATLTEIEINLKHNNKC